jgi:polysaccharide export outer membrane protein
MITPTLCGGGYQQSYAMAQVDSPGVIGPDDTVTIQALNVDEISRSWRVTTSGDLSLPMIGRLHAAGMTVEQLEQEIASRLKQFVRNPQVTAYVAEFRSHPATVSGAVERPGTVQLEGPTSLFDVIVRVGGPKEAGPTVTVTREREYGPIPYPTASTSKDGAYSTAELPLADVLKKDTPAANLQVNAYDVITVSRDEKQRRMVYITGEVNRPGAIELVTQDKVSFSQALAMAGGITHTASPKKAILRHIDSSGLETSATVVNASAVLAGRDKDIPLSNGDIVIIPSSHLAMYMQTITATAISSSVVILGRL